MLRLFSCPVSELFDEEGSAFPLSEAWLNARFEGLFGEGLREQDLAGAVFERVEDRSASFALGGKGTARGDGVWGGFPDVQS